MTPKEKAAPGANRAASSSTFDSEILAEIPKNSREVYCIVRRDFKGFPLVDVRVWFDDATTGELRPGRGVSIKLEVLLEMVAALSSLIEEAAVSTANHDTPPMGARQCADVLRAKGFNDLTVIQPPFQFRGGIRLNVALYSMGTPEGPVPGSVTGNEGGGDVE